VLLDKQEALAESAAACPFTALTQGPDTSLGILAAGLAYNYVMECFPEGCPHPLLKLAQYPFPTAAVQTLLDTCDSLLVVEDGFPFIEDMLHGPLSLSPRIRGRRTGHLPREGELNPGLVAAALGREASAPASPSALMRIRPPRLCSGCPHCDSYQALVEVLKEVGSGHVFSDIGCYTLGALPPYDAISTCVDMGASISMAKGAADAGLQPAVAVIGDSTFTHSGMTPLLDAVWENTNITVFILDNSTTGMTGGQDTPATGRLEAICAGLGIPAEHVRVLNPMPRQHDENVAALREEIFDYAGPSVVIARRECIHTMRRRRQ
jgi:indolepyruvate ferredoxin oxidoreductase alpha subunit